MRESKTYALLRAILAVVSILCLSVMVPLAWQGFYAMHVDWYQLDSYVGLPREALLEAYSQIMTYCMGYSDQFSAGVFPFSAEGAAHFADVRVIFVVVARLAIVAPILYLLTRLVGHWRGMRASRPLGRSPECWGVAVMLAVIVSVGIFAALDFTRAFTIFHTIFFPGQSNWLFDWQVDPIILVLPEAFFRNCAILIGGMVILFSVVILGIELWQSRRRGR